MVDDACFSGICNVLSIIDHTRRPNAWAADCFGPVHVLLFGGDCVSFINCESFVAQCLMILLVHPFAPPRLHQRPSRLTKNNSKHRSDFKQLPPASSRAPFIVHPLVAQQFEFRCLRENRRVVQDESRSEELDSFHTVLTDISHGATTKKVRDFMIDAYVRGYQMATAEHVPFEGSTAVFTRRRYRDKWNRTVVRRVSKTHNHSIKIRACVRPKGVRSGQWYTEERIAYLRKKCRTQSLWNLHLAGPLTGG